MRLIGDKSLSKRDFSRVIKPLRLLGVNINLSELEERAKQVDSITNQLKDIETNDKEDSPDMNYIG